MNNTLSAERVHIGFFGMTNSGKSSIVNAITGQNLSIVSPIIGTTTDPVRKTMELLPLGPVVIIDTPGLGDNSELGELRNKKTTDILKQVNIAVLVVDATVGVTEYDEWLIGEFRNNNIPYVTVYNKVDLMDENTEISTSAVLAGENSEVTTSAVLAGGNSEVTTSAVLSERRNELAKNDIDTNSVIYTSTLNSTGIDSLKTAIADIAKTQNSQRKIVSDLISPGDIVVLVVPIDEAAPKDRLILPQQQTIRDILDIGAIALVSKETELEETLNCLGKKPKLVITDSQVFGYVSKIVPQDIYLTSFSILFMRYKGNLDEAIKGANALDTLQDGDTILISEGCTHHRQCADIGTVKLPACIKKHTGKSLNFEFSSGHDFPSDVSKYALVIHCGGCMITEKEVSSRINSARKQNVPFTNYGITIAKINGILERSLEILKK